MSEFSVDKLEPEKDREQFYSFWDKASETGEAGAGHLAYEQDWYDVYGLENSDGLQGIGAVHTGPVKGLSHAFILPSERGKTQEGKSLFRYLVQQRIEAVNDDNFGFKTDATTRHPMTQHVFETEEFGITGYEPSANDFMPSYIQFKNPGSESVKPEKITVPKGAEDLINNVYADGAPTGVSGETLGYDLGFSHICSEDNPGEVAYFNFKDGEKELEEVLEPLRELYNEGYRNMQAMIDLEDPGSERFVEQLISEGFVPTGIEDPFYPIKGTEIALSRLEQPDEDVYVTENSLEFIGDIGLDYDIKAEDRSYKIDVLPTI